MRVTPGSIHAQMTRDLQAALGALAQQQRRVAASRRILAPSDDPAGAAQSLAVRTRQSAVEQFHKNAAAARSALTAGEAVLRSVSEVVTQALETAAQGANDTNDALARQSLGAKVNQLLETLASLAQSRGAGGTFLFGGQESTTTPYAVTRDASGQITAVTPNARGLEGEVAAEISEGVSVATGVSGTSVFGPATDQTYAFDVLIRLRDALNGARPLGLEADVDGTGATNASRFLGIDAAGDLTLTGPAGTATVGLTVPGDDALSYSGKATSAIALAARINLVTASTGITAAATQARITFSAGTFASDVTLDGTSGKKLSINGTAITGAVTGSSPAARRDALVGLINAALAATGVAASAVPGTDDFTLTAADGRNISIETDANVGAASINAMAFGFATGLTATGALTTVVARGGVRLTASGSVTVTAAAGSQAADQIRGEGTTSIQAALDELRAVQDRVVVPITLVGTRLAWLGLIDERLGDEGLGLAEDLSRLEGLDLAPAITELTHLEQLYQATLASSARLMQLSLLDFLR